MLGFQCDATALSVCVAAPCLTCELACVAIDDVGMR